MQHHAVDIQSVSKRFGGVHALKDVSLQVRPGEIHAIVGENGAGKSTLMKILSGAYPKDAGSISIFGTPTDLGDTITARNLGVGIIYQEFSLAADLSVAENIHLGGLGLDRSRLTVPFGELVRRSTQLLDKLGFRIDPRRRVGSLRIAHQQVVEIAKALSRDARILILDEPTAVLTDSESEHLFAVLNGLRAQGVSILYVSHRLDEIFRLADRISVMKDGVLIATRDVSELTKDKVITLMVGRELSTLFPRRAAAAPGPEILRVTGLSADNGIHGIDLSLRRGEVLGLSGLIGSGRTEFARALFGLDRITSGEIHVDGRPVSIGSVQDAKRHRIGLIPEDRKHQGLALDLSILRNIPLARIRSVVNAALLVDRRAERAIASKYVRELRIKCGSVDHAVSSLSGGNQQKVVIAKWLNTDSEVLILDEPTRGVDVGAKVEIYELINALAARGYGVILISSELSEIIGMSDRVVVFREGTIAGDLKDGQISEEAIMSLAFPANSEETVQ